MLQNQGITGLEGRGMQALACVGKRGSHQETAKNPAPKGRL
jgi:hypothetical protein